MLEVHVSFSVPYELTRKGIPHEMLIFGETLINIKNKNRWKKIPAQPQGAKKILNKTKLPTPPQKYYGPSLMPCFICHHW